MGLLDEIGTEQEKTQPNRCPIQKMLPELSDADVADLETAMSDDGIRHVAIARALEHRGFRIGDKAVAAHRKGTCACAR